MGSDLSMGKLIEEVSLPHVRVLIGIPLIHHRACGYTLLL